MKLFGNLLAGLLAGIAGAMGLGGGSVLLIYLTVFAGVEQLQAQGLNLWFFLPTAAIAVAIYAKRGIIRWKSILPMMVAGIVMTLLASLLLQHISPDWIRKIFGGLLLVYGLLQVFQKSQKSPKSNQTNRQ